jgi:hypothetical protein
MYLRFEVGTTCGREVTNFRSGWAGQPGTCFLGINSSNKKRLLLLLSLLPAAQVIDDRKGHQGQQC